MTAAQAITLAACIVDAQADETQLLVSMSVSRMTDADVAHMAGSGQARAGLADLLEGTDPVLVEAEWQDEEEAVCRTCGQAIPERSTHSTVLIIGSHGNVVDSWEVQ